MKYNRKQLCELSDVPLETFKFAAKINPKTGIDDLPLESFRSISGQNGVPEELKEERSGYAVYSAKDALMMALAREGSRPAGYLWATLSFSAASKIVSNNSVDAVFAVERTVHGEEGIFIGYGAYPGVNGGGGNVSGTLSEIERSERRVHQGRWFGPLFLINVSAVLAELLLRAERLNFEFDLRDIVPNLADEAIEKFRAKCAESQAYR